ncbi:MAG: M50 family metallopeptidase [Alicyclobacillus sp.]|nr:M50 family metallopeptidase [Alicyclobacillus sp.]
MIGRLLRLRHGRAAQTGQRAAPWWLRLQVHPLAWLLAALAAGAGLWQDLLLLFILVMLHELGHAAAAEALGYEVEAVILLPFGGVARLSYGSLGFIPRHEAMIAAAGPAVNLALMALAAVPLACGWWSSAFFERVVELNAWLVAFNLLPGLPLDGGRVLRAARSRAIGYEAASKEAYGVALVLAAVLFLTGCAALVMGYPHAGLIVLGVFLLISAWLGRRQVSVETVRFLDVKRHAQPRQPLRVRSLLVPADVQIRDVVRQFAPDRYHLVYVRNEQGEVAAVLEEDELLEAVFAGRWLDRVSDWLQRT